MRHLIFHNFGLKVFSTLLAVLVWFAIQEGLYREGRISAGFLRATATREFRCPVTVLAPAAHAPSVRIVPAEVSVKVAGDPTVLTRMTTNEIHVFVDLSGLDQPQGTFDLEAMVPQNARLQQVLPPTVSVAPAQAD